MSYHPQHTRYVFSLLHVHTYMPYATSLSAMVLILQPLQQFIYLFGQAASQILNDISWNCLGDVCHLSLPIRIVETTRRAEMSR